jgi:hypothetical protein
MLKLFREHSLLSFGLAEMFVPLSGTEVRILLTENNLFKFKRSLLFNLYLHIEVVYFLCFEHVFLLSSISTPISVFL